MKKSIFAKTFVTILIAVMLILIASYLILSIFAGRVYYASKLTQAREAADQVGIIARVSSLLAEENVNILDISQTIMKDLFTMIMLVDLSASTVDFTALQAELKRKGEQIGVDCIHNIRRSL